MTQFAFCTGVIIFVNFWKPLETPFANNMATLDEVTIMLILYCLMHFTSYVDNPYLRSDWGIAYITFLCIFTSIHMVFIISELCHSLKLRIKYAYNWRHVLKAKYTAKARDLCAKVRDKCCKKKNEEKPILDQAIEEYDSEDYYDEEEEKEAPIVEVESLDKS